MLDDPATDQLQPLHDRTYDVQVFRRDVRSILVRGMVHDVKPPGLYVDDDPDPLTMHRMRVELEIEYPALVIRGVDVEFDDFPQTLFPMIADAPCARALRWAAGLRARDRAAPGHGSGRGAVDLVDGDPEPACGDRPRCGARGGATPASAGGQLSRVGGRW